MNSPIITITREHNGRDYDVRVTVELIGDDVLAIVAENIPEMRRKVHTIPGQIAGSWEEDIPTGELAFCEGQEIDLDEEEEMRALDAISRFPSEEAAKENRLFIGSILKP